MTINVAGTWLAHPRLAAAIEAVSNSPTARNVLETGAQRRTRLVFDEPPTTVREYEQGDGTIASYHPATNTVRMGPDVGVAERLTVTDDAGTKFWLPERTPTFQGTVLVHEVQHKLQNRYGATFGRFLLDPITAPIAGARELGRTQPGETRSSAFMRGVDKHLIRDEIEARQVDGAVSRELGQQSESLGPNGEMLDADALLESLRSRYVPDARQHLMRSGITLGGAGGLAAYTATNDSD